MTSVARRSSSSRSSSRRPHATAEEELTATRRLFQRKNGRVVRRVTLYLSPDLARWLRRLAADLECGMSDVVSDAVLRYLQQLQKSATSIHRRERATAPASK